MTLIEGVGDEVIQFLSILFLILIAALAWCTTNMTNEGNLRTIFLLERRRIRAARRLTNHTESATISEGTTVEDSETNQTLNVIEDKPSESSFSTNDSSSADEETRIVEAMDAPREEIQGSNDLRRRRLAFYNRNLEEKSNCSPTHDYSTTNTENQVESNDECLENAPESSSNIEETDKICIKLMFLNDELRHVDGRLEEKLGDFKRRHFQVELESNKLVKLIFNGHVLHQDTNTLANCGFFDNCVVHCLIQRNNLSQGGNTGTSATSSGINSNSNNNNQPHEWHLENYLFAILCCFLGAAWYLRYVYAHLYTITATIGLVLMTGIFSIIMFGMHFPQNVDLNQQNTANIGSNQ